MSSPFHFTRLEGSQRLRTSSLGEVLRSRQIAGERWLFVSPHDDDACIGGGLWMHAALADGVEVHLLVVTDGRMGYCTREQEASIVATRHVETIDSCRVLGVSEKNLHWIGYPDGGLYTVQGRRPATAGEQAIERHVGLQNAFTYYLRQIRPTRLLVPTHTDLHPDHQITHNELMISLFHASGAIWPELGEPIPQVPTVYEMAVYCEFAEPPNLGLKADARTLDVKLQAIAAFRSQLQIAQLVENVRAAGPYEFLHEVQFKFYSARNYIPLFES